MFDGLGHDADGLGEDQAFDILQELEQNTPEEIRRQRTHFRVSIKAGITLQSGNASELLNYKVKGVTGDISQGGLGALFPFPARVGDVYRLEFDRQVVDLPLTFVRCVRCHLVREQGFECGFTFFAPIMLPANVALESKTTN
jgi:hypothetical protein